MTLFENYIPGFFSGASSYYSSKKLRKNRNKHPVQSESVLQKLRSELRLDIELYEFVKQRFYAQINHINSINKNG